MGLSKEQLRRRSRALRQGVKRGRACAACVALANVVALALGLAQVSLGGAYDPALDARCVRTLKETQRSWFEHRACHYSAREARADFIAAELALTVRARHAPGPCVVMTIGLPEPGSGREGDDARVMRRRGSVDAGMATKMGFWVNAMANAGAFECETRTYVDERAVETLSATLKDLGHDNSMVEKLWNDRRVSRQLDEEFEQIAKTSPKAKLTVLINDAKRSRSQFARFKKGLASGKVSTIIWRREITSKAQRKALLGEVKLVAQYGYSVYLAGASADADGKATPTAYLRVDHGAWDDIFATPNSGIELTIVAVARDNKFKTLLDQTFGLCPVKTSVLNFNEPKGHSCHCDSDRFTDEMADSKCSLQSRLGLGTSTYNWFSSLLSGRTDTDAAGVSELEEALGGKIDSDERKLARR